MTVFYIISFLIILFKHILFTSSTAVQKSQLPTKQMYLCVSVSLAAFHLFKCPLTFIVGSLIFISMFTKSKPVFWFT